MLKGGRTVEIHLDDLIGTQRDIAEVIGIENYIKLCKAFGGDTVYIQKYTELQKVERKIIESISHTGTGSVMQAIGVRNPCTTPIQTSEKKFLLTLLVTNFERL